MNERGSHLPVNGASQTKERNQLRPATRGAGGSGREMTSSEFRKAGRDGSILFAFYSAKRTSSAPTCSSPFSFLACGACEADAAQ